MRLIMALTDLPLLPLLLCCAVLYLHCFFRTGMSLFFLSS